MKNDKPVSTPLSNHFKLSKKSCLSTKEKREQMVTIPYSFVIESLIYVMVCTRSNIAHAVSVVNKYFFNPRKDHYEAGKWIFRYLRGGSKMCLCFDSSKPILERYIDADITSDLDSRKSTSWCVFTFAKGVVS